jgi:SNF2 family DNA or RNA helicase
MLRRVKTDVELDIPPKKELLVFTPLTPLQDELYRALLSKTIHDLLQPKVGTSWQPLKYERPIPPHVNFTVGQALTHQYCATNIVTLASFLLLSSIFLWSSQVLLGVWSF